MRDAGDRRDRGAVGLEVAVGVGPGQRRLAEHVESVAVTALAAARGALQGLADGPSHDELVAHDAHRLTEGAAHDRLAQAAGQPLHERGRILQVRRLRAHQAAGEHQSPGRGVDEQGVGLTEVIGPAPRRDLVGDQPIGGVGVRNPEQRLGNAHEDHALAGAEVVLLQEGLDAGGAALRLAQCLDQLYRITFDLSRIGPIESRQCQQVADDFRLVGQPGTIDRRTEGRSSRSGGRPEELAHHCPLVDEGIISVLRPITMLLGRSRLTI